MESLTLDSVQPWLKPRPFDANKGDFGHVLVLGGDYGMPGAVSLSAIGAARVGAGLVTIATRPEHVVSTMCTRPELLCYGLDSNAVGLDQLIEKASVILLGPGLGNSAWSKKIFDGVVASSKPMVMDADGLNWLAKTVPNVTSDRWILTPHPGEAARLLGICVAEVQSNRQQAIRLLQARFDGVIVLKGAGTLLATRGLPIKQCVAGNPGMASAGMGDLLSGMIAGFVAQGFDLWSAAQLGVMLHATAGDKAAHQLGERGLLASDLLPMLHALVNPCVIAPG